MNAAPFHTGMVLRFFNISNCMGVFYKTRKRTLIPMFLNFRASDFLIFTSQHDEILRPYNQKYLRFLSKYHYHIHLLNLIKEQSGSISSACKNS